MADEVKVKGFSELCLAAIHWILGMAAVVWFGIYITGHNFNRQVAQEKQADAQVQRQADWVGEKATPVAPVKITIHNDPRQCVKIESAHFDGDDLWVYSRRTCGHPGSYVEMHWHLIAADGTVISGGFTNNTFNEMEVGERSEYKPYNFKMDPRATALRLSITGNE